MLGPFKNFSFPPFIGLSHRGKLALDGTSSYKWNSEKRLKAMQPDRASVINGFYPTGLLKKQSKSRDYPVESS